MFCLQRALKHTCGNLRIITTAQNLSLMYKRSSFPKVSRLFLQTLAKDAYSPVSNTRWQKAPGLHSGLRPGGRFPAPRPSQHREALLPPSLGTGCSQFLQSTLPHFLPSTSTPPHPPAIKLTSQKPGQPS